MQFLFPVNHCPMFYLETMHFFLKTIAQCFLTMFYSSLYLLVAEWRLNIKSLSWHYYFEIHSISIHVISRNALGNYFIQESQVCYVQFTRLNSFTITLFSTNFIVIILVTTHVINARMKSTNDVHRFTDLGPLTNVSIVIRPPCFVCRYYVCL